MTGSSGKPPHRAPCRRRPACIQAHRGALQAADAAKHVEERRAQEKGPRRPSGSQRQRGRSGTRDSAQGRRERGSPAAAERNGASAGGGEARARDAGAGHEALVHARRLRAQHGGHAGALHLPTSEAALTCCTQVLLLGAALRCCQLLLFGVALLGRSLWSPLSAAPCLWRLQYTSQRGSQYCGLTKPQLLELGSTAVPPKFSYNERIRSPNTNTHFTCVHLSLIHI